MPRKKTEPDCSKPALERTYAMTTEQVFIPVVTKSLVESIRDELPKGEGPPELVAIVTRCPGLYSTFLGKIVAGSSFYAASLSVGLPPYKMRSWLQEGSNDLADDIDSYYSRFLLDCQRAASISVSDAEERVHRSDPAKWLSRSPTGRDFNKGKYWQEQVRSLPGESVEEENSLDPPPMRRVEDTTVDDDKLETDLQEALKVLQDFSIVTNPEFIKQAKQQFKVGEEPRTE